MCQRIGLPPISIMGFGRLALSSEMRVPSPPARITAFMIASEIESRGVSLAASATPAQQDVEAGDRAADEHRDREQEHGARPDLQAWRSRLVDDAECELVVAAREHDLLHLGLQEPADRLLHGDDGGGF